MAKETKKIEVRYSIVDGDVIFPEMPEWALDITKNIPYGYSFDFDQNNLGISFRDPEEGVWKDTKITLGVSKIGDNFQLDPSRLPRRVVTRVDLISTIRLVLDNLLLLSLRDLVTDRTWIKIRAIGKPMLVQYKDFPEP